jgi:quercetin dioxygenase-like cupin family protein
MFVLYDRLKAMDFGHGIRLTDFGHGKIINVLHWQTPAGTLSPVHDHPEEQFGYIVKGAFEVTIGAEQALLKAGDSYFIPGGAPHQFRMVEDSVAIDVFSPLRPVPVVQT